ncbi:MAG: hypothetical protein U5R14_13620 [Gemmatimonadota bacterium]|nr:hypothetical protein [Gemmatimonadota bacterium]
MSGSREDPSLPSFTLPESIPPIGHEEPDLAVAAPGASSAFRLDGARVSVHGTANGPVTDVWIDGTRVAAELDGWEGAVANTVTSPGRMRRERVGRVGSAEEVFLVPPSLPFAAFQWTGSGAAPLRLRAWPDAPGVRYRIEDRTLTLAADDSDRLLVVGLMSGSGQWTVQDHAEGDGVLLVANGSTAPRTLLLALGTPDALRTAMRSARLLATHEAPATTGPGVGTMRLRTGVRELDDAVAWMSGRLRHGVTGSGTRATPAPLDQRAWLWAGLAATATGDEESAERCASILERLAPDEEGALLAGSIGLATGKSGRAVTCAERLLDPELPPPAPHAPGAEMLRRLARHRLADALRYAAPEEVLSRLREEPVARGGVGLPTVGTPPPNPPSLESWIRSLVRDMRGRAVDREDVGRALRAWADTYTNIDAGWASWRSHVGEGLTNGHHGIAAWDGLDRAGPPAVTGLLLAGMAYGWLGSEPDAPVGRLRLAPRIPTHVTRFHVSGIPIGDARVALAYERTNGTYRFELEVERGRVPPLVAFEPTLGCRVERVRVDEAPADPEITLSGTGTTIRLQTPLDAKRRIEVDAR